MKPCKIPQNKTTCGIQKGGPLDNCKKGGARGDRLIRLTQYPPLCMRSHPGRIVTIYVVPCPVTEAQLHSLTIQNIQNGFRVSGIHLYNRNVIHITDEDFAPAEVTSCPDMGIVDCVSDVNDQQDSRIQNISDPDELSKQESSNSTGAKICKL